MRALFPNTLWRLPVGQRRIALTFDDGPVPEQTPWVLDLLDRYGIKATFFCVGDNVRKYPQLFEQIKLRGHSVGNHTFNHLQLLRSSWNRYASNVALCTEVEGGTQLFRPPHGQMSPWRAKQLAKQFRRMVLWDVMPMDYSRRLTPEQVFANVKRHVRDGSIIVFHDSIKAGERMRFALQSTIQMMLEQGYSFARIDDVLDELDK